MIRARSSDVHDRCSQKNFCNLQKRPWTQYPDSHSSGREKLTVTDHDKKPILLILGSVIKDKGFLPFFFGTCAPRFHAVTRHRTRLYDDFPYTGERKTSDSDSDAESESEL
ncbi:hypothetical protein BGY98DRAFT_614587 [Russula aff. rugulosa BPL654]|jgi:hypothetical protein|nr:hypothetical protein BGY98DRAFT_614587 [Russula aff. rugulosa BPL654]